MGDRERDAPARSSRITAGLPGSSATTTSGSRRLPSPRTNVRGTRWPSATARSCSDAASHPTTRSCGTSSRYRACCPGGPPRSRFGGRHEGKTRRGFGAPAAEPGAPRCCSAPRRSSMARRRSGGTGASRCTRRCCRAGDPKGTSSRGWAATSRRRSGCPAGAYRAALDRNAAIASRVIVRTPDPYLDAAVPMMAFATEGTWGDAAYLHGGWSWRFAYLGWRGWYGPDLLRLDRPRPHRSIRSHAASAVVTRRARRGGARRRMLESPAGRLLQHERGLLRPWCGSTSTTRTTSS